MKLVIDASSLLVLVKNLGSEALEALKECCTIPLLSYEVGNAIRTSAVITQQISIEEAGKTLENIHKGLGLTRVVPQDSLQDSQKILGNSIQYGLTYYDAAYLTAAENLGATIVTEDRRLSEAARKAGITVQNADQLSEKV
jgi:predicted nucleic acid-binding protein